MMRTHAPVLATLVLSVILASNALASSGTGTPPPEGVLVVVYQRGDAPPDPAPVYERGAIAAFEVPSSLFDALSEGSTPLLVVRPVISLAGNVFDPARDPAAGVWSGPGLYLIQFRGPLDAGVRRALEDRGVLVLDYVPHLAYLVWVERDPTGWMGSWGYVRAFLEYRPRMKLSEGLSTASRGDILLAQGVAGKMSTTPAQIARSIGGDLVSAYRVGPYIYMRFDAPISRAGVLAERGDVAWVEAQDASESLEDEQAAQISAGNIPISPGYAAWLATKGVDGSGIVIGHVDTGVYDQHMDIAGRLIDINTGGTDSNGHGTHTAGICCGDASSNKDDGSGYQYGQGMAPMAKLVTIRLGSMSHKDYMENIAQNNGTVTTFSWNQGTSGSAYGSLEREYDTYVMDASSTLPGEQPVSVTFSAGNRGPNPGTMTRPHCAKNVISVANTLNARAGDIDSLSSSSSRGPCQDGRIKPDVGAPGTQVYSARTGTTDQHTSKSGTSMAAPHVAGGSILIQQWYRDMFGEMPFPSLVKAMHINGAVDMTGVSAGIPNTEEGWGRINLNNVIENGVDTYHENEKNALDTGDESRMVMSPSDPGRPFKVTLVWSDAPGASGANPALVNDLDLIVEGSEGTYYGNDFQNGWSQTGGSPDTLNNIESVFIKSPTTSYTVRVVGTNVPQGPQRYSLVVYNTNAVGPRLTLATPKGGELLRGGDTLTIDWSSSGGIVSNSVNISFSQDGGGTWTGVASSLPANGTHPWVVPGVNTTSALIRLDARTAAGGSVQATSGAFTIDSSAPISTVEPLPPYTLTARFNLTFTANDTVSGVEDVQVFYREGSSGPFDPGPKGNSSPIAFTAPSEGRYGFYTIAGDRAGNMEPQKSGAEAWTVVDLSPPRVVSTSPANGSTGVSVNPTVSLIFSESMDTSSITVNITPGSTPGSPSWSANDTEYTFTLSGLDLNTEYTVSVAARDPAGRDLSRFYMKFTTTDVSVRPATLRGRVLDGETSGGIPGADIEAYINGTTTLAGRTSSDASGAYMLTLDPGTYDIDVTAPGYEPGSPVTLDLNEDDDITRDFMLYREGASPGWVTGTVKDVNGVPVRGANISTGVFWVLSDTSGAYTLTLAPGTYTLTASRPGYEPASASGVIVTSGNTTRRDFVLVVSSSGTELDLSVILWWVLLLGAVAGAILGALILVRRRKRYMSCPFCQAPVGPQWGTCPSCGFLLGHHPPLWPPPP